MLNISQSLLHPDQYSFGIKSPVLVYSSDLLTKNTTITNTQNATIIHNSQDFDVYQQFN